MAFLDQDRLDESIHNKRHPRGMPIFQSADCIQQIFDFFAERKQQMFLFFAVCNQQINLIANVELSLDDKFVKIEGENQYPGVNFLL